MDKGLHRMLTFLFFRCCSLQMTLPGPVLAALFWAPYGFFFQFFLFCVTLDEKYRKSPISWGLPKWQWCCDTASPQAPWTHLHVTQESTSMLHQSHSPWHLPSTQQVSPKQCTEQHPARIILGMAGVMLFIFSWWFPLCLIWKCHPSCAPEANAGTGVHGVAVLLTSGGCRDSLRRATCANIMFPCFSETCKETQTKLQRRSSKNVFLTMTCHRKGMSCSKC